MIFDVIGLIYLTQKKHSRVSQRGFNRVNKNTV